MEILGGQVAISTLISACCTIITGAYQLHQRWKQIPQTLTAIVATCRATQTLLEQAETSFFDKSDRANSVLINTKKEEFIGIKVSCFITLSSIKDHVRDLLETRGSEVFQSAQRMKKRDRFKALWNETDMKESLDQLKNYRENISSLLNVLSRLVPLGLSTLQDQP